MGRAAVGEGAISTDRSTVFIDAIDFKVRDGQVANRLFYAAIGVDLAGHRDVLGLWAGTGNGESAKFWLHVLTELEDRGVEDVFFHRLRRPEGAARLGWGGVPSSDGADVGRPSQHAPGSDHASPAARAVVMARARILPCACRRGDVAATQPDPYDHRRSHGGREDRELRVQPTHPRVAVGSALLGVAVDLTERVVDIEERQSLAGFGADDQPRDSAAQPRQDPGSDRVELLDVTVGEGA